MKKNLFLTLSLVFLFGLCQTAQAASVSASLDKSTVPVNGEVRMTIVIEGAQGNIQAPRLPGFQGFDTFYTGRESHMTFINGQGSSSVKFSYILVPREPGKFVLDPIEVRVGGQSFRTAPMNIEVLAAQTPVPKATPSPYAGSPGAQTPLSAPAPVQAMPSLSPTQDPNIFVKAWLDQTVVYPNQQVLLTYSLYTRYDTRYEGFEEEPQVSGFWIEEFPPEREVRRETVRIDGKRYLKADVKKVALFPTAAADYTIDPGSIKVSIRHEPQSSNLFDEFFSDSFFQGGSFFSRRENRLLAPPELKLQVRPFPESGRTATFQGAVGNFRLNATVDKTEVEQNQPVTMTLTVEGEGNIETLSKPNIPDLSAFKIYEADTSSQLFKSGNVIGGRKTFEIVFIPLEAGELKIPSLEFSFFNPALGTYQRRFTPEFAVKIKPSEKTFELPATLSQQDIFKKDVQMEGKDIRYIQDALPDTQIKNMFRLVTRGLLLADGFLFLLVLTGLWRDNRERIFAKDSALRRRTQAKANAEVRMRQLKSLKGGGSYFDEVEKILTQYLSDKFDFSAFGVTRQHIEQHLEKSLGIEDPLYKEIMELYRVCEESRFAGSAIPESLKGKALKTLKDAIKRIEKMT